MNQLVPIVADHAPAVIAASGPRASYRFLEFFTGNIRNPHARRAYARAGTEFFDRLAAKGVTQSPRHILLLTGDCGLASIEG
jgi:hypothetical protein